MDLAREITKMKNTNKKKKKKKKNKLRDMRVKVKLVVIGELGTVRRGLKKRLKRLEIKWRMETI